MLCKFISSQVITNGGIQMKNEMKDFQRYANSFKSFKARHKLTNQQITNIMTEYANTVDEQGASFFASKYGFSEYVFYQIKDYTIVFMLVDASICVRIRDKSFRNQSKKNPSGNYTPAVHHYKDLLVLRKEYLKTFSNEDIVKIATEYANNIALYDIAKKHKISTHTVQRLLAIALTAHLVSEPVYKQIRFRSQVHIDSLHNFRGYTVDDLWNNSY